MQTGLNIVELAQKLQDQAAAKKDYIVDTRSAGLNFNDGEIKFEIASIADELEFDITNHTHRQIGERVGIPAKYYDRMKAEAPELLVDNVNHWFRAQPENRLVRTMNGTARAFLSDRYQRIDNVDIAQVALPVLLNSGLDLEVVSSEVTESRLYIQAVSRKTEREVRVGDAVRAGVIISNSEVGLGAVSVAPVVFRLVCSNGLIVQDQKRRFNHIGKSQTEDDIYRDDTRKAEDRAVLLKVRDQIAASLDEVRFQATVERMAGLTQVKVTDPVKTIELVANRIGASDAEGRDILTALINGGDLTAWGVLNAVTAQAHTAKSYDRSVEFEAAGGDILDLAPSDWRELTK